MSASCFYIVQQIYVNNTVCFKRPTTAHNFWILYYIMVLSQVSPHSCHVGMISCTKVVGHKRLNLQTIAKICHLIQK